MHNDGLVVSRQTQASQQCAGNATSAQKYGGLAREVWGRDTLRLSGGLLRRFDFRADSLHTRSAHARSAASMSAATSVSVCAVEMIQCRPFEGVM